VAPRARPRSVRIPPTPPTRSRSTRPTARKWTPTRRRLDQHAEQERIQRKGRFFSWETYAIYNTHNPLTLGKVNGPNDGESRPLNPSLVLDYSDVFLDGKLGVVMNLAETNSTSGSGFLNFTYNPLPTAPGPLPTVITGLQWGKGAIIQKRRGGGLNLEYKLTPQLTLALRGQASWEDARNYNKNFAITATRATLGAGSNDLVFIGLPTANNVNRFNLAGGLTHRIRNTHSFSPQLFYEASASRSTPASPTVASANTGAICARRDRWTTRSGRRTCSCSASAGPPGAPASAKPPSISNRPPVPTSMC
jgi:hypothetical protein